MSPQRFYEKSHEVEAMRFEGSAAEVDQVISWMHSHDYPWLIGDATEPETLRSHVTDCTCPPPMRGIYIDPGNGNLMIRTPHGDKRAKYGDWIVREVTPYLQFFPVAPEDFDSEYVPAGAVK